MVQLKKKSISVLLDDSHLTSFGNIQNNELQQYNWWNNIILEDAELLQESIAIISELHDGIIYEFQLEGFHSPFIIYGYQLAFDNDEIFWGSYMSDFRISDRNVYFSIVKRNIDGLLTAMVYSVQVKDIEMSSHHITID